MYSIIYVVKMHAQNITAQNITAQNNALFKCILLKLFKAF